MRPEEWVGTDITFDVKQENDFTIVLFGHRNWEELFETGKGKPSPRNIKIDNWN